MGFTLAKKTPSLLVEGRSIPGKGMTAHLAASPLTHQNQKASLEIPLFSG